MAITKFIAALWSAQILMSLQKNLVYGNIVNRDYEGEIKDKGDRVKINSIGPATIKDFTKNTDIDAPETLTDDQRELVIDQGDYFNFQVDDVDRIQSDKKLFQAATGETLNGLADVADQFIASLYTGVDSGNTIGDDATPVVPTKADAYEYLVDLGVKLDDAKVPKTDRWVVVSNWFYALLLKDDRFVKSTDPSVAQSVLINGAVGFAAGFTVYKSNNVPNTTGTKYKIIAGYRGAISFADQIVKTVAYSPEKRFADALKGLHTYGAKLVRPTGIAVMTANKA